MQNPLPVKHYLSIALALACTLLIIFLIVTKQGDNARHENDAGMIDDFSNRLDTAQSQLTLYAGRILVFSNNLIESQSAVLASSNRLIAAESTIVLGAEQITNLNRRIAEMTS